MGISVILGLIIELLWALVIFYVGKIISNPLQMRNFFGWGKPDAGEADFASTLFWMEKAGGIIIILALLKAVLSIVTNMAIIFG